MHRTLRTFIGLAALSAAAASLTFGQDSAPRARTAANRGYVFHVGKNSYLGIGVAEIDAERAKALNLKEVRGVEVKSVDHDSPADKAGLKESDVVLEYNGQRIEGTEQFVRLVHETPVDRQVKLVVWRNGSTRTLTATIGQRNDQFSLITGDDNGPLMVQVPPMPPMPAMPEMPSMPEVPMPPDLSIYEAGRTGRLGIECEALGSQLAAFFGVKEGVLVRSVSKDSAAAKAGMRAGDVIIKVDGESVSQVHEVTSLVRAARSKRSFPVVVVRDKKEVTLPVTVDYGTRGMRPVVLTGPTC